MNVTTIPAGSGGGGLTTTTSTCLGHGVRRDASILGAAVSGGSSGPLGLKKCVPSKWSLFTVTALYHRQRNEEVSPCVLARKAHVADDLDGDREPAPF